MRKKIIWSACLLFVIFFVLLMVGRFLRREQKVSQSQDIMIGVTPAYELIEISEWAKSMSEGEYLGINNTKAYGRNEYITDQFYDRNEPVPQVEVIYESNVYDNMGNEYVRPDNVYGEKWTLECLADGPHDMDKGMASALHFLSTIQFLQTERKDDIYSNFKPNVDFIDLALSCMEYEYIWTELSDGFVIELIGGVQIRFYVNDKNEIPYAELIVQDIVNAKNEPLILEINLQTKLMREENETEYQVPERKSTLITQYESEDAP